MDQHYNRTLITALIETIATWTTADKDRLAATLGGHCYPGGPADRQEPSGIEPLLYQAVLQHLLDLVVVQLCEDGDNRLERFGANLDRIQRLLEP